MIHICLIWSNLVQFGPTWSNLDQFGHFWANYGPMSSPIDCKNKTDSNFLHFGLIWPFLDHFVPHLKESLHSRKVKKKLIHIWVQTRFSKIAVEFRAYLQPKPLMVQSPMLSNFVKWGQFLPNLVKCGLAWSSLVQFGLWPLINYVFSDWL